MPVLCPGDLATASKPFGSIDKMWLAFGGLSTNKTPTINGDEHFTLPPLAGLSLHSHASGRTQGRSTVSQPSKGSSGSSRNPIVMNVAPSSSPDPFLSSAPGWPANSTAWDEVFQVAESFVRPDVPLWTPLTIPEERRQVFRDNKGRYLNCHGKDHSFRNCAETCINAGGCIAWPTWRPWLNLPPLATSHAVVSSTHLSWRRKHALVAFFAPRQNLLPPLQQPPQQQRALYFWPDSTWCPPTPPERRRRHSRRRLHGQLANGLPASTRRAPSTFLRHPSPWYAVRSVPNSNPNGRQPGTFHNN